MADGTPKAGNKGEIDTCFVEGDVVSGFSFLVVCR